MYTASLKGVHLGLPLALSIGCHNVGEGMAVAAPIFAATGSTKYAIGGAFASGLVEPAAVLLIAVFGVPSLFVIDLLLAACAGVMCFLAVNELLPTALDFERNYYNSSASAGGGGGGGGGAASTNQQLVKHTTLLFFIGFLFSLGSVYFIQSLGLDA